MAGETNQVCRLKGAKGAKPARFTRHGENAVRVETGDRSHVTITAAEFAKRYEVVGKAG